MRPISPEAARELRGLVVRATTPTVSTDDAMVIRQLYYLLVELLDAYVFRDRPDPACQARWDSALFAARVVAFGNSYSEHSEADRKVEVEAAPRNAPSRDRLYDVAFTVGKVWRDQEGVSGRLLDQLADLVTVLETEARR